MAPAWLRNPAAPFIAGIVAVVLSTLALIAADQDTGRSDGATPALTATEPRATFDRSRAVPVGRGSAVMAQTDDPDEFLDLVVVVTGPGFGQQTIVWTEDYEGRSQVLVPPPDISRGTLYAADSVITHAILRETPEGQRELGIVFDATAFGSGSPTARLALLRLEGEEWIIVWDSGLDEEWRGSHGTVEFPSRDLSELVVRSDSWGDGYDELSDVLHESNPGPHRYFVDTWIRDGDMYVRQSAETVAAPYATLVKFLHVLSTGDEVSARAQVTEADLISRARDFGMDDAPGRHWLVRCDNGFTCGIDEPIRFSPSQARGEPPVAVYFEEIDGEWLISDIQPDDDS